VVGAGSDPPSRVTRRPKRRSDALRLPLSERRRRSGSRWQGRFSVHRRRSAPGRRRPPRPRLPLDRGASTRRRARVCRLRGASSSSVVSHSSGPLRVGTTTCTASALSERFALDAAAPQIRLRAARRGDRARSSLAHASSSLGGWTIRTSQCARRATPWLTLPPSSRSMKPGSRVPTTIKSACCCSASSTISSAG
jgi:hypothetical protein